MALHPGAIATANMTDDEPAVSGSPRQNRTEPVPPETHGLVADVDATPKQQIFDLP